MNALSRTPFSAPPPLAGPLEANSPALLAMIAADMGDCEPDTVAAFMHDETEECERCQQRFFCDELNGESGWDEPRTCDDCYTGWPS